MNNTVWRSFFHGLKPKMLSSLGEGYSAGSLRKDALAGMTVGVVALPLAMAFAIASGVGPERGLYTAIVAGVLISLFSGSRFQIGGPTGAFVVIVSGVVHRHGVDGLTLATLMAAVILLILSLSGLGALIRYIPYPVTTGFTTGIAVIIFSSQIKDLLGLPIPQAPAEFIPEWRAYFSATSIGLHSAAIGVGSLAALAALRLWMPRVPAALIVVAGAAAIAHFFQLPVETIGDRFGDIPRMLPAPSFPPISIERLQAILPDALTIAALAGIESLLSAVVADGMTGDQHRPNAEIFAQGVGNIGSALFGGIPATGAIARTATNIRAGAVSPVAGVVHAATLLLIMMLASPLARSIPLAALAAVLVMVAWSMAELDKFRHMFRAPRSDTAVLLTTFLLTVLVDLNVAIQVGFLLASLLFMKRMIQVSQVNPMGWLDQDEMEPEVLAARLSMPEVQIYEISGPFFFGVADRLKSVLRQHSRQPKVFILRMRHVPAVDATGLHALRMFCERCSRNGTTLILSGVQPQPERSMRGVGLDNLIGRDNICLKITSALDRAREIVQPPVQV